MLLLEGMSDQRSAWPKGWPLVKLTWCSTILGHQMPLPGLCLTKGQSDQKIDKKCQTDPKPHLWEGLSDLSAKRTFENLNTLCISCFALQRSLQKTNKNWNQVLPPYVKLLLAQGDTLNSPSSYWVKPYDLNIERKLLGFWALLSRTIVPAI